MKKVRCGVELELRDVRLQQDLFCARFSHSLLEHRHIRHEMLIVPRHRIVGDVMMRRNEPQLRALESTSART